MTRFKNNILMKNIIILLLSGGVSKAIGMIGKVIYTRTAGINVVGLYTLLTPTFMLIITITQFSFPISISKISAEDKYDNNMLLKTAYKLGFVIDLILIIIIMLSSNLIASFIHNNALVPAIRSICVIIPFVTISSVQRGFLHGKEDMFLPAVTSITEEIIKIILIVIFLPYAISISNVTAVIFIILFNVFMELSTIIILNKRVKRYVQKTHGNDKNILKDIIKISLPTTLIRLISSFGFFLEPIILTNTLLSMGYSSNYITLEYGIINSYIVPLLSFPSFFSLAIAAALLPNITKLYTNKKYNEFNRKLLKLMIISILVGVFCLSFILIFPNELLKLIYNVNLGINYIYLLGPFFLILYMQPTLSIALQAMGKTNKLFITSIVSLILKYSLLFILCKLGYGMNSLIYSIIIGIVITTLLVFIIVVKNLNKRT